jgi:hypothetical protein
LNRILRVERLDTFWSNHTQPSDSTRTDFSLLPSSFLGLPFL